MLAAMTSSLLIVHSHPPKIWPELRYFAPNKCIALNSLHISLQITNVVNENDEEEVKYGIDAKLVVEKYEIS